MRCSPRPEGWGARVGAERRAAYSGAWQSTQADNVPGFPQNPIYTRHQLAGSSSRSASIESASCGVLPRRHRAIRGKRTAMPDLCRGDGSIAARCDATSAVPTVISSVPTGLSENTLRHSLRLRNHDYRSRGWYFVTIVTFDRLPIFGALTPRGMILSAFGRTALQEWERTGLLRSSAHLGPFAIMPDHVHGLIELTAVQSNRAQDDAPDNVRPGSLGAVVRAFKSATTRQINIDRGTPGEPVWQRGYFDRVVRDEKELRSIERYVVRNALRHARSTS
jgi:putative transposase